MNFSHFTPVFCLFVILDPCGASVRRLRARMYDLRTCDLVDYSVVRFCWGWVVGVTVTACEGKQIFRRAGNRSDHKISISSLSQEPVTRSTGRRVSEATTVPLPTVDYHSVLCRPWVAAKMASNMQQRKTAMIWSRRSVTLVMLMLARRSSGYATPSTSFAHSVELPLYRRVLASDGS
jgi:hypothetical protein